MAVSQSVSVFNSVKHQQNMSINKDTRDVPIYCLIQQSTEFLVTLGMFRYTAWFTIYWISTYILLQTYLECKQLLKTYLERKQLYIERKQFYLERK